MLLSEGCYTLTRLHSHVFHWNDFTKLLILTVKTTFFLHLCQVSDLLTYVWMKTPSQWEHICDSKCKGTRQSPVNIDTDKAIFDSSLTNFTFSNFSYPHSIIKCVLENNVVTVKGGGLRYEYASTELHFHWGNTTYPGSEHSVNQNRHLMEGTSDKETPEAWKNLTSHLVKITNISDDLLNGVNLSKFYRYNGSLTTPTCDEAVVWTVFQEPISVSKDLVRIKE
uniref:Carbonic anhydrase 4 n=1 Tax=Scleropages formosus TaxID=113540 RepID=A0A8C9SXY7_SCLFO